jgi:hypothetical protein
MKLTELSYAALVLILLRGSYSAGMDKDKTFPEFEFDVWASPPSQEVYVLSSEPVVQRILYSMKEKALSAQDIAVRIAKPQSQILEKLEGLSGFGLVRQEGDLWISCIPLFTEGEIHEAEKVGQTYAEKQAKYTPTHCQDRKLGFLR